MASSAWIVPTGSQAAKPLLGDVSLLHASSVPDAMREVSIWASYLTSLGETPSWTHPCYRDDANTGK